MDAEILDVKSCFDKLWAAETANDAFDNGLTNDHFVLSSKSNNKCNVSIKLPWGKVTKPVQFENIEMQGSVNSPLRCSMTTDTLGKDILSNKAKANTLYRYKGFLPIPPLALVDDLFVITKCGVESLVMNGEVHSKIMTKRLELGIEKCFQMHFGKKSSTCHSLMVDSSAWMEKTNKQKYLGSIVASSAKADENIRARCVKSITIKNEILSILNEIKLGQHHFELAFMMHSSMFINGILFSLEALVNITEKHVDQLMACEKDMLCQIFKCQRSVPLEALYIESNVTPIKFILMGRRVMFFWTILNKSKSELVCQTVEAMIEFPDDGGWMALVRKDLHFLDIQYSDEYLAMLSKKEISTLVRRSVERRKHEFLLKLQANHSKSSKLEISGQISEYLISKKISNEMKIFLFKLKCRMTSNKVNFRGMYSDMTCRFCQIDGNEEFLEHFTGCIYLIERFPEITTIHCDDIYSDLDSQINATRIWWKVFKLLDERSNYQEHS